MGDFTSGLTSGLSSLGSLFSGVGGSVFNPGASASNTTGTYYDPYTGMAYGAGADPTGSIDAQAAITGNYGAGPTVGPAGAQDIGGSQSNQSTGSTQQGTQSSNQPSPYSPPVFPAPLPTNVTPGVMQGQPSTVNPWQPGATPPSPDGSFAQRWGVFQPPTEKQPPGWYGSTGQQIVQSDGYSPVTSPRPEPPDEETDDGSQPDKPQAAAPKATATPPPPAPQPGAGRGGVPGPTGGGGPNIGGLLGDIAAIMSGNPMGFGKLMQDLFGGGGMPGGVQIPGYDQPSMLPNQAGSQMMPGDPSTFGGPQYAGATPGETPQASPLPRGAPPAGAPRGAPPAGVPPGRQMPPRQPGQTLPPSMQRIPDSAVHPGNRPSQIGAVKPSAPPAAGQQAATPLSRQEVSVPGWVAQRGGSPPMRPSQSSVDRSQFKNTPDSTIYKLAWMVNGEIGSNASPRQQIVQAETALNRAQSRRQSLDHVLLDNRSRYGYYDGNSQHPTYRNSARPTPQQFQAFKQNVWPALMAGSNLSDVGWGPMTGNASAGVARNQYAKGTRGYTYSSGNGESYFREPDVRGRIDNLSPMGAPGQ